MKRHVISVCCIVCLICACSVALAQNEEKLTITTYYPSSTGVYNTLRTKTLGVGDTNQDGSFTSDDIPDPDTYPGSVWIAGNMTIGAAAPAGRLCVVTNTTNDGVLIQNGTTWMRLLAGSVFTGAWNHIVSAQDNALIFGNGTVATEDESLVIAPWVSAHSGLRMNNTAMQYIGGRMELGQRSIDGTTFENDTHMLRLWGKSGCASNTLHNGGRIYGMMSGCNWNNAQLHIEAGNQWDSWVPNQIVLRGNGNVGIGTDNPTYTLDVESDANTHASISSTAADMRVGLFLGGNHATAQEWAIQAMGDVAGDPFVISDTGGADRLTITTAGNVGIGTNTPDEKLVVNGNVKAAAFYYSSDRSLKNNLRRVDDALSKITKLEGVYFDWKNDGRKDIGLVAQDVEKVFPELVGTDNHSGLKSVEYGNLVAPLIEAIKDQQRQIDGLKDEIRMLREISDGRMRQ